MKKKRFTVFLSHKAVILIHNTNSAFFVFQSCSYKVGKICVQAGRNFALSKYDNHAQYSKTDCNDELLDTHEISCSIK